VLAGFELTPTAPLDEREASRASHGAAPPSLLPFVQRDNADTYERRARNARQSSRAARPRLGPALGERARRPESEAALFCLCKIAGDTRMIRQPCFRGSDSLRLSPARCSSWPSQRPCATLDASSRPRVSTLGAIPPTAYRDVVGSLFRIAGRAGATARAYLCCFRDGGPTSSRRLYRLGEGPPSSHSISLVSSTAALSAARPAIAQRREG